MSIRRRKINYYSISFSYYNRGSEETINPKDVIETFAAKLASVATADKKMDIGNNRFCMLDSYSYDYPYLSGYFISAKTRHRPPLIDEATLGRRQNPKNLTEGEEERTHFAMKIDESSDEIVLLLESRNVGITPNVIIKYIKKMLNDNHIEAKYGIIARENFIDELENLSIVKACDVYVEKELLGSDALNFSAPTESVQDEIMITLKAKRKASIKDSVLNISRIFIDGVDEKIKRVRVHGLDDNKNPITLNTANAQLTNYINVKLDDETRIVDSDDILRKMEKLLEDFNV